MRITDLVRVKGEPGIWRIVHIDQSRRQVLVRKLGAEHPQNKSVTFADIYLVDTEPTPAATG